MGGSIAKKGRERGREIRRERRGRRRRQRRRHVCYELFNILKKNKKGKKKEPENISQVIRKQQNSRTIKSYLLPYEEDEEEEEFSWSRYLNAVRFKSSRTLLH